MTFTCIKDFSIQRTILFTILLTFFNLELLPFHKRFKWWIYIQLSYWIIKVHPKFSYQKNKYTIDSFFYAPPPPWHMEIPGPGSEPEPRTEPEPQLWSLPWLQKRSLTRCMGGGLNLHLCNNPSPCSQIRKPLCHSRNSYNRQLFEAKLHNTVHAYTILF